MLELFYINIISFNFEFNFRLKRRKLFLPGTMSGGIRKDIHETTTNKPEGK